MTNEEPFSRILSDAINRVVAHQNALIEEYAERSLLDPEQRGVLVEISYDRANVRVSLSSTVPWGEIHEHVVGSVRADTGVQYNE